jgi:biotin carboxyl carrier protein
MKMETPLRAPFQGKVIEVRIAVGNAVSAGEDVIILEPAPEV